MMCLCCLTNHHPGQTMANLSPTITVSIFVTKERFLIKLKLRIDSMHGHQLRA